MYYALIPDLNTYLDCLRSHSVCSFLGKSCFLAFVLPVVLAYCPSCGLGLLSFLWSWPIVLPVVLAYYPSCGLWPIIHFGISGLLWKLVIANTRTVNFCIV